MEPHPYGPTTPTHSVSQGPPPRPTHYIRAAPRRQTRASSESGVPSWVRLGGVPPPVPDPPFAFSASFNPKADRYTPRTPRVVGGRGADVIIVDDHLDNDTPPPDELRYTLDPTVPPFRPDHIRRLEVTPPPDGGWQGTNPAVAPFRPTRVRHIEATPPLDDIMEVDALPGGVHLISAAVRFDTLPEGYRNDGHSRPQSRRESTPGTDPESSGGTKVSESSKVRSLSMSLPALSSFHVFCSVRVSDCRMLTLPKVL